jgi:hypothetical protein
MDTRITQDKFATVSEAEIYAAAQQARAEFLVELLFSAGRGLRRAGHWLAHRLGPKPAPAHKHGQSLFRCPECPSS